MSDPDAQWGREEPAEKAPCEPDIPSLLVFAARSRGQAWTDRLVPTMNAALSAGWSKDRWAAEACRLIIAKDGDPQEITDATRNPLARSGAVSAEPPAEWRQARQALEHRRAAS